MLQLSKEINIGFDAKRAYHNTSGLGNYSRDLIRLAALGQKDWQFYLYNPKQKKKNTFGNKWDNVHQVLPSSLLYKVIHPAWRSKAIINTLKKDKIQLYHGLSNELPLGISKSGIKSVVTIHDLIFLQHPELYKSTDRVIYRQKFAQASIESDKIIAVSQQTKRDLIEFLKVDPDKIHVIYQVCNPVFKRSISEEKSEKVLKKYNVNHPYLLSVGSIEKRKNQGILISALKKSQSNLSLVIVGKPGSYKNELIKSIKKNNLKDRVVFVHGAKTSEIAALYSRASLFAYPSLYEGFGIPILEALSSKVPVITTKGGVFTETGGDAAVYVNPEDSIEIAGQIDRLVSEPAMRESMIHKGLHHTKQFEEKKVTAELIELYESLL